MVERDVIEGIGDEGTGLAKYFAVSFDRMIRFHH
jgi:hypothetical protein